VCNGSVQNEPQRIGYVTVREFMSKCSGSSDDGLEAVCVV